MMRRDWDMVRILLDVSAQLAGHPNLKELRDDALADLKDLSEEPTELPEFQEPAQESDGVLIDEVAPSDDGVPVVTGRRRI